MLKLKTALFFYINLLIAIILNGKWVYFPLPLLHLTISFNKIDQSVGGRIMRCYYRRILQLGFNSFG